MFPEKMSKAREILQEWSNELPPLLGLKPVRIIVDFHDLFDRERDRLAFSTPDAIFVNPHKVLGLTDEFKQVIKWKLVWVWASRNNIRSNKCQNRFDSSNY